MELLVNTIIDETKTLMDNNIRLQAIGNLEDLPKKCLQNLNSTIEKTANNSRMTLVLALSYSSKKEVAQAVKSIVKKVQEGELKSEDINEDTIQNHLFTHNIPDPELLIRTSGEQRISNFLLWQIAYSELYFTKYYGLILEEKIFSKQLQTTKKEKEDLVKLVNKLKKKMLKNSILISIVCVL